MYQGKITKISSVEIDATTEEFVFDTGEKVLLRHVNSIGVQNPHPALLFFSVFLFVFALCAVAAGMNSVVPFNVIYTFYGIVSFLFAVVLYFNSKKYYVRISTSSGESWWVKCENKEKTKLLAEQLQIQIRSIFSKNIALNQEKTINSPEKTTSIISTADELLKLKRLVEQGVLSEEEFNSEKQKILNKVA